MRSDQSRPALPVNGPVARPMMILAIVGMMVFALGVFIGYHSVYRDIAVAALPAPGPAAHL